MIRNFLWLGTEESASDFYSLLQKGLEKFGTLDPALSSEEDEDDNPIGYQVEDGLAILTIKGPTWTSSNEMTRWYGIATYEDIRNRLVEALDDQNIKQIMLNIDSPGGQASGVGALSKFISRVDKIKPVRTHTGGMMASAAMWYGSAAREVVADEDARVGSIGVISVHFEYTEAMKKDGVKATVFRSAPYKALGQPYEKLSEAAERQITKEIKAIHDKFVSRLATNLKLEESVIASKIATGEVFDAPRGLALGLVHRVATVDETVARLSKMADNSAVPSGARNPARLEENGDMKRKGLVISKELLAAAAASGADVTSLEEGSEGSDNSEAVEAEAKAKAEAEAKAEADRVAEAAKAEVAKAEAEKATAAAVSDPLSTYLKEENSKLSTQVMELKDKLRESEAKVSEIAPANARFTNIVRVAATRLVVALGGKPFGIDALEGLALADQFDALNSKFETTFSPGRVSRATDVKEGQRNEGGQAATVIGLKATKLG